MQRNALLALATMLIFSQASAFAQTRSLPEHPDSFQASLMNQQLAQADARQTRDYDRLQTDSKNSVPREVINADRQQLQNDHQTNTNWNRNQNWSGSSNHRSHNRRHHHKKHN